MYENKFLDFGFTAFHCSAIRENYKRQGNVATYPVLHPKFFRTRPLMFKRAVVAFSLGALSPSTSLSVPLGSTPLKRVEAGRVAPAGQPPIVANDLWRDQGAVILVVRRPG